MPREDPDEARAKLEKLQALRSMAGEQKRRASMRFARYRDRPVDFVTEVLGDKLWTKQAEILDTLWSTGRVVVPSCFASGKVLALDTPVPTPTGWTMMGDLTVGDEVFDERGKPCSVVGKSPVWADRECFRVTFDDGHEIVADGQHEWVALSHRRRGTLTEQCRRGGGVGSWADHWVIGDTITTEAMAKRVHRIFPSAVQSEWGIPTARPVVTPSADLPLDPYVLGVWLGDGCATNGPITSGQDDVAAMAGELVAAGAKIVSVSLNSSASAYLIRLEGLYRHIRLSGLRRNKHVPAPYLRASIEQRLALLQGIMDADGHANAAGVSIDLCNERLALNVAELIRSLGWKVQVCPGDATLDGRVVGTRWRMAFTPDAVVFRLPRKRDAQNLQKTGRATMRMVVGVDPVQSVPTQCIEVDSPSNLFLAGDGFIPSHNSFCAARAVLAWVATDPDAIAITTAPSWRQVETILWGEIRSAYKAELPGALAPKAPTWYVTPSNWGRGFSTDDPTRFQGFHQARVLVVMDEAAGVDSTIYGAMQGLLAGGQTAALLIGNPIEAAGDFYNHALFPDWNCLPISAFDTPNLANITLGQFYEDPEGAIARCELLNPNLVSPEWVLARYKEWGPDSPQWQSKVLGEFPDLGERIAIPLSLVNSATGRIFTHSAADRSTMGLDIARFGGDASAICIRRGPAIVHLERKHGFDGPEVAGWATSLARQFGVGVVNGDAGGLGGPVLDMMRRNGLTVVDVNSQQRPRNVEDYLNARAEMWWGLRQRFFDHDISIVEWDETNRLGSPGTEISVLRSQLATLRYQYTGQGKVQIESKEDAAKRGIKSPDLADACALSFYSPSGAVAWLDAISAVCAGCGQRNRRRDPRCSKCGLGLDPGGEKRVGGLAVERPLVDAEVQAA